MADKALEEPYVRPVDRAADTSCRYAYGCDLTTVLPDSYFVMGDNRDKAAVIYWSWDRERRWPRWERLGRPIR
jgi:hypothetical protein